MNFQEDRASTTPPESSGETTESLWCPADATEAAPRNAGDDDLVEKLAIQLDQWLLANGCRLMTTPLARPLSSASISTPINTATQITAGVPTC